MLFYVEGAVIVLLQGQRHFALRYNARIIIVCQWKNCAAVRSLARILYA
jgi:hypothetical protein